MNGLIPTELRTYKPKPISFPETSVDRNGKREALSISATEGLFDIGSQLRQQELVPVLNKAVTPRFLLRLWLEFAAAKMDFLLMEIFPLERAEHNQP